MAYLTKQQRTEQRAVALRETTETFTPQLQGLGIDNPRFRVKVCYKDRQLNIEIMRFFDFEVADPCYVELTNDNQEYLYNYPRRLFYYPGWEASVPGEKPPYTEETVSGGKVVYVIPFSALEEVDFTPPAPIEEQAPLTQFEDVALSACTARDLIAITFLIPDFSNKSVINSLVKQARQQVK